MVDKADTRNMALFCDFENVAKINEVRVIGSATTT